MVVAISSEERSKMRKRIRLPVFFGLLCLLSGNVAQVQATTIGNWSGSARSWNQGDFATIKNTMMLAGHTVEANEAITAANLANNEMFIIGEGLFTPNAAELTDLANFVNAGGALLVFTNSNFTGGPAGNGILSGIGSGMSFTSAFVNAVGPLQAGNFATEGPPFNIVGQNLAVSPGNIVNGGTTLYGVGLHFEQIGSGFLYAFGDRYDHNVFGPNNANTNGQLFLNIAEGVQQQAPEPTTLSVLVMGLAALRLFRKRPGR